MSNFQNDQVIDRGRDTRSEDIEIVFMFNDAACGHDELCRQKNIAVQVLKEVFGVKSSQIEEHFDDIEILGESIIMNASYRGQASKLVKTANARIDTLLGDDSRVADVHDGHMHFRLDP